MSYFESLFRKSLEHTSSEAEKKELQELIATSDHDEELVQLLDEAIATTIEEQELPDDRAKEILALILDAGKKRKQKPLLVSMRWWAAAAVVLLGGFSWFAFRHTMQPVHSSTSTAVAMQDILPVSQSAILTLADGRQVALDSLQTGNISNTSGAAIHLQKGSISYIGGQSVSNTYNTLSTPRGRIFHLILPDGSEVWLNAASSLRYPIAFTSTERVVELQGEAYFEIKQSASSPFRVKVHGDNEIQVLGTGFNVNAYTNEPHVTTTLLHGSIQAVTANQKRLLKPGQQALMNNDHIHLQLADTSQATAWKEGVFQFDSTNIQTVMNQLERWYDIEVIYENGIPDIQFGGKMERDLSLNHILRIMEISNVHYRLEGKKLYIKQ
ncbi:MAG: DUF4974 domain-containing protein [Chitinophaga sp.]|uniref:FecR family protein n=1 Tax=Chitinophaga sp. TaxID=1869181 RepID=UPI0025C60F4A|nr:FecR family protein [Chitinophaga sp.]MBV8253269.1 DUF4974 domain-containing protein [Chitinophaga sp.]